MLVFGTTIHTTKNAELPRLPDLMPINKIISNLIHEESSGYHTLDGKVVTSHRGAKGRYQITAPALADFNTFAGHKKEYTMTDILRIKINKMVGEWYFKRYKNYYGRRGFDAYDRVVLAANCYNMGHGNTEKGKIYFSYVSNICPKYFIYFIKRREITNVGSKILRIKSLYPNQVTNE